MRENVPSNLSPLCRALRKWRGAMHMRSAWEVWTRIILLLSGWRREKFVTRTGATCRLKRTRCPAGSASEASDPEEVKVLTDFLASQGYREIDVNMGTPVSPLIVRRGKGAGILSSPEVEALLEMMKVFPEIRFSVKMRLGGQECGGVERARAVTQPSCVTQVTLHPRIGRAVQGGGGPGKWVPVRL